MRFADEYLAKQSRQHKLIKISPAKDLKFIGVIPAYNESGLIRSLDSLFTSALPSYPVEVIVVFNWPFNSNEEVIINNLEIKSKAEEWARSKNHDSLYFHFVIAEPENEKKSGVGFARKVGMDEAIRRFRQVNLDDGIIISLDADVVVSKNYFIELENHFKNYPFTSGCSIYFEHPLDDIGDNNIRNGIIMYELHQRYYTQSLRYTGHPNVFHTVGSAFAVKAESYCLQGGMNERKAGEDFYFLQKLFDLGNFTECNTTCVFPSPRPSTRVPFGTGPIIKDFLDSGKEIVSFNFELFEIIKEFLEIQDKMYNFIKEDNFSFLKSLHPLMIEYLENNQIVPRLREIYDNSGNWLAFRKRFYRWFNMFRMLKFLNFGKSSLPDMPVKEVSLQLLNNKGNDAGNIDSEGLLKLFREIEKKNPANPLLRQ